MQPTRQSAFLTPSFVSVTKEVAFEVGRVHLDTDAVASGMEVIVWEIKRDA